MRPNGVQKLRLSLHLRYKFLYTTIAGTCHIHLRPAQAAVMQSPNQRTTGDSVTDCLVQGDWYSETGDTRRGIHGGFLPCAITATVVVGYIAAMQLEFGYIAIVIFNDWRISEWRRQ